MRINFRIANPAKSVILVPTFINGKGPYEFAVDTGASVTVLSTRLSKIVGINSKEVKQGLGAGGTVGVSMSKVESLAVGEAVVENLEVAIANLDVLSQATGVKLDGIIGYNYLKNFRLTIDYPKTILSLE